MKDASRRKSFRIVHRPGGPRLRAQREREDSSAALDPDPPSRLEAEVCAAGEPAENLFALPARHRRPAAAREGGGCGLHRLSLELGGPTGEFLGVREDRVGAPSDRAGRLLFEIAVEAIPEVGPSPCLFLPLLAERGRRRGDRAANAVAREGEIAVGAVPAERETARFEETPDLGAGNLQKRPYDAVRAPHPRAGEAGDAAVPLAGEEERLDDVLSLVCRGDPGRARLPSHFEQSGVAQPPRARFRREAAAARLFVRVAESGEERELEPAGVIANECEIAIRLASAPAVVHVADGEAPAERERGQGGGVKERQGVRPARNREEHRAPRRKEAGSGGAGEGVGEVHVEMVAVGRETGKERPLGVRREA
jgi:hypothetical protein